MFLSVNISVDLINVPWSLMRCTLELDAMIFVVTCFILNGCNALSTNVKYNVKYNVKEERFLKFLF